MADENFFAIIREAKFRELLADIRKDYPQVFKDNVTIKVAVELEVYGHVEEFIHDSASFVIDNFRKPTLHDIERALLAQAPSVAAQLFKDKACPSATHHSGPSSSTNSRGSHRKPLVSGVHSASETEPTTTSTGTRTRAPSGK